MSFKKNPDNTDRIIFLKILDACDRASAFVSKDMSNKHLRVILRKGKSRKIPFNTLWDGVLALDCKFPKSILHLRKTYTPRRPTSILPTLIWLWSGVCSPLLSFKLWSVLRFNRISTLWKPGTTPTRWKDNVNFLLISHWAQAAFKANLCFRALYIYSWSWS